MAIKNANRKANRKRDERKNETREKEETPSAPIKIPPPLQHAALLTLLVRSQVAPALVVSLTAFFKSALWLFVALTPALELRSFVYFECFYMHLKWIRAIIVRLTECSSICVCVCVCWKNHIYTVMYLTLVFASVFSRSFRWCKNFNLNITCIKISLLLRVQLDPQSWSMG